jgi:CheY-like chemotaxis protein/HD-like signal output (HDOD) protein
MANILLIDPSEIAKKVMKGVLARDEHRFADVNDAAEAWAFVTENVKVDLVFIELKLGGSGGLPLIERLHQDNFLKLLPVVVYTTTGDRDSVRRAMECKVQNFLVKPYDDEHIRAEIGKALVNPWRDRHFEEETSFCKMMGYAPEQLREMLENLRTAVSEVAAKLTELAEKKDLAGALVTIAGLSAQAEAAGAWGVVESVGALRVAAEQGLGSHFTGLLPSLGFAERLIFTRLNPDFIPTGFASEEEQRAEEEARARAVWFNAEAEQRCPVVEWPQIRMEIDALSGCPVIDSVAASFQMTATGHPSSLSPLMDLTEKDPGLTAYLLFASTHMRSNEELDPDPVENPRISVSLLGEKRLAAMARGLPTAEQRKMSLPPCSWPNFWLFQTASAHLARYLCRYLEFNSLQSRAYTAAMLPDIGKLMLLHLHPFAFPVTVGYARMHRVPLAEAEQKFLGCTTRQMAAYYAQKKGLFHCYTHVLQWVDDPAAATEDAVLVAIVALAREFCRQNEAGWGGEPSKGGIAPIAETPAWLILRESIFPSFNLDKFESETHAKCRELKQDLGGRMGSPR